MNSEVEPLKRVVARGTFFYIYYVPGLLQSSRHCPACRTGIIPLDATSDVAGPLARTIEDAVRVFEVTVGVDPADNLTSLQTSYSIPSNYTQFLVSDGLQVCINGLGFRG